MVREQDDISIAFSLWQQARAELAAAENRLLELRLRAPQAQELDVLDAEISLLRVKADRLLGLAIEALRQSTQKLVRRPEQPE